MNGPQGHRERASHMLLGVETELRTLDEANDALAEVVALGFTDKEARLALRAEPGNVAKAVKYAEKERKRNEKAEIQKKYAEKARAERQRIAEEEAVKANKRWRYGKTESGSWVNLG